MITIFHVSFLDSFSGKFAVVCQVRHATKLERNELTRFFRLFLYLGGRWFDGGQALKTLRTSEFKPHVVYVKCPPFDELKETRSAAYARSTFDENNSRGFSDQELLAMVRSGQRIEYLHGHLFDDVIVNGDLSTAFERLLQVTRKLETQPQWVPVSWVVWSCSPFALHDQEHTHSHTHTLTRSPGGVFGTGFWAQIFREPQNTAPLQISLSEVQSIFRFDHSVFLVRSCVFFFVKWAWSRDTADTTSRLAVAGLSSTNEEPRLEIRFEITDPIIPPSLHFASHGVRRSHRLLARSDWLAAGSRISFSLITWSTSKPPPLHLLVAILGAYQGEANPPCWPYPVQW